MACRVQIDCLGERCVDSAPCTLFQPHCEHTLRPAADVERVSEPREAQHGNSTGNRQPKNKQPPAATHVEPLQPLSGATGTTKAYARREIVDAAERPECGLNDCRVRDEVVCEDVVQPPADLAVAQCLIAEIGLQHTGNTRAAACKEKDERA